MAIVVKPSDISTSLLGAKREILASVPVVIDEAMKDKNNNGKIDLDDVKAATGYSPSGVGIDLGRQLVQTPNVKVTLLGEQHQPGAERPLEYVVSAMSARGKHVTVGLKIPNEKEFSQLTNKLIKKEINNSEFKIKFNQAAKNLGYSDLVATTFIADIERIAYMGATGIILLDMPKSEISPARDGYMAKQILQAIKKEPETQIVASVGAIHAQLKGNIPPLDGFNVDFKNPLGKQLVKSLGDKAVFSVAMIPVDNPMLAGFNLPNSTHNSVIPLLNMKIKF